MMEFITLLIVLQDYVDPTSRIPVSGFRRLHVSFVNLSCLVLCRDSYRISTVNNAGFRADKND